MIMGPNPTPEASRKSEYGNQLKSKISASSVSLCNMPDQNLRIFLPLDLE